MTPAHDCAVCESADAELRGDPATALSLHRCSAPAGPRVNSGRKLEHVLDGRRRGEFHRSADETLGWTTKVHRPGESFVGQPMKLPKLTPSIGSAVLFLPGDRVIGRLAEFLDAA
jgi:hypothetical protein